MRHRRRFMCLFLTLLAAAVYLAAVSEAANRFFQSGLRRAASGEIEPAIGQFEAAIRIEPDFAGAWFNLGALLQRKGEPEAAIEHLNRVLTLQPGHAGAYNALGLIHEQQGEAVKAIAEFRIALAAQPKDPDVRHNLAIALFSAKEHAQAAEELKAVI